MHLRTITRDGFVCSAYQPGYSHDGTEGELYDLADERTAAGEIDWTLTLFPTDAYAQDALGNRMATLNPEGDPVLMLAGHMDELGLIITYINKEGFLYFDTIGGHDRTVISGRRVNIQTRHGVINGVTGTRAIVIASEPNVARRS